jgi:long-chain acyl-CoA synthetase
VSGTVVDEIRARAASFPGNVAIADQGRNTTFAQLFERVDRLSMAFVARSLGKGQAVLAYLPNVTEAVEVELAVLQSGLAWVTLNSRLTWAEVRGVVAACEPRLVVTDAPGLARIAAGLRSLPLSSLPAFIVVRPDAAPSGLVADDYEAVLAASSPSQPQVVVGAEDVARLRYTSGTTGSAKAAVLPHRVYHASLRNLVHELGPFTEADRVLHVAPLTHGSGALLYPALHAGATNVLLSQFDPASLLDELERHAISVMFTVPTILSRLVSAPGFADRDLSALRALVYGGAPMPESQLRAATAKIARALVQIYGMSEAPWPITMLKAADHVQGARLDSVGKPTLVCEVRVVDDAGTALPPGGVGEIQIRGDNVMSGYHRDPEGTAAVLRDGWLSSGDVGRFDDAGYLYIVGRAKDVIISGGFNVYAAEVEAVLTSLEGVLEVAVVGEPHDEWGEQVVAHVVPRPGVSLPVEAVLAFCRGRLSGYKCPKRVEIAEDLPKNASGKIQKSALRK